MPAPGLSRRTALALAFAGLFALLLVTPALAVDTTWRYDADWVWDDPAAWTAGVPNAPGDIARLTGNITSYRIISIDQFNDGLDRTVGQLVIGGTPKYFYRIRDGTLALNAGGGTPLVQVLGGIMGGEIETPLKLSTATVFDIGSGAGLNVHNIISAVPGAGITKQGAGTLFLSEPMTTTFDGGVTVTGGVLSFSWDACLGTGDVTLAGGTLQLYAENLPATRHIVLAAAGGTLDCQFFMDCAAIISGPGNLTITGTDTVTLEAGNTYTGGTTVRGFALIKNDSALGTAPASPATNITLCDGGVLSFGSSLSLNPNRNIVLSGGSIYTDVNTVTIGSVISGAGCLTMASPGKMVLTGNNTFTGGTTVSHGILEVTSDAALGAVPSTPTANIFLSDSSATLRFSGGPFSLNANRGILLQYTPTIDVSTSSITIPGVLSGDYGFRKAGTGMLTLSGNNTFSGDIEVASGTLRVTADAALGPRVGWGGIRNIKLDASSTFQFGGAFIVGDDRWFLINSSLATIDTNGFDAQIDGVIWGSGILAKYGSGTLTLTASNTQGSTQVHGGILRVGSDAALGAAPASPTINIMLFPNTTFQFDAAFDLNLNRKISTLISGGPAIDTNGFNVTIASAITGSFTKAGQGTLTLTGTNSGGVTVAAGALRANDGAGLPVRNLVLNGGVLEGLGATTFTRGLATSGNGTMQWTGSGGFSASGGKMTVAIGGAASLTALVWGSGHFVPSGAALLFGSTTADGETEFQNAIDLAAGTRTVTVTDNPAASGDFATISGTITNGVFVKDGPGALRLLAANAYAGGTTVKAGMLIAAASGALGSGPVQLGDVSGAASPALLFENASTVASTITVQDDGSPTSLRTLGGTNTSGRASFAGGVTLLKDLTLTAALGGEVELAGTLDDSAGRTITKIGDGLIILDGTHTYGTGAVLSVLGGKVELDTDAGSASVATLVVNVTGAELDFGSDQHLDTLDIGPGGIVRFTGARTVVLNHLVMEGIDYGAATITPEPATLALLASGGLLALARRREDGKTRSNRDSSS